MMNKTNGTIMQFSEGIEKIRERILDSNIKVVSFDIFDTLLFRPVSTPADIFRLLENKLDIPNFHNMRVTAEAEARRYKSLCVQDVTLEDIYETYAKLFRLSEAEKSKLMQEELDIEYTLLYARKSAKYLYEQALEAGKEVIVVSDMYLSSTFLNKCLAKNGYTGHSKLYVSSETGVLKSSKLMFQLVLSEMVPRNIMPSEILHIGDNKKSDVDSAIATGLNAAHLPKPIDIRGNCKHLKRLYDYILGDVLNSNNAMLYGIMLNLYFDDPFVEFERNSFFNGDAKLMGYWFAPLLTGFAKWMVETIEENEIEEMLFVWRDGYLPSKLFQLLRPLFTERKIDIEQIYMGRALRMPYMSLDKNGFFTSFADYGLRAEVTVDYFIKKRLLCEDEEQHKEILNIFFRHGYINGNTPIGKFEQYRGFLWELEPYFIENSKKVIERYSRYINSTIDREKKVAIFDRSPRGKSSRFLKQYFDIDSRCITTEVYDTFKARLKDTDLKVNSYLEYGTYYINKMGRIWAMLFERIISDTAPGFKDIIENNDGTVSVLLDSPEQFEVNSEADEIINIVQEAIVEYTEKCCGIFGKYFPYVVIDRHGVFDYAIDVLSVPHKKDAELIVKINPDKSTLAPIDENTFINWYNGKFKKQVKQVIPDEKSFTERIRVKGYVMAERLGILPQARAVYRFITRKPQNPELTFERIQMQTEAYLNQINDLNCGEIDVLFTGSVPTDVAKFFNCISRLNEELKIVFAAAGFIRVPTCFDFPCIVGPEMLSFWGIEGAHKEIAIPSRVKEFVNGKEYLCDVVKRRMLKGYSESMAILCAYEGERYFRALIEKLSPKVLLVWNNWGNNSVIPAQIAREYGIKVLSAERGFLEGTIMLSANGYGQDKINLTPEEFCNLSISVEEVDAAEKIISFLKSTGFNRYNQPVNKKLEELKQTLNNGRPNIIFVGSFDCENPAFPENDSNKKYYSPIFSTSRQAVLKIAEIGKRKNWNVIFKAHPLMDKMIHSKEMSAFPNNVYCVKDVNINELIDTADVVIGMISGVSYIALTRGKPLVQLAYTPLKGKKCCYEAYAVGEIENAIQEALEKGFTEEQQRAFVQHVAQVNKYYYFDDLGVRPIRYGRTIKEAAELVKNLVNEKSVGGN